MIPTPPRKNRRQWRTIICLINDTSGIWVDDTGEGHLEFIDDISRLREKGWPIIERQNEDGISKSYRINREEWDKVSSQIKRFW